MEAALTNGMLAHADETDDTHAPSIVHPGCSTVPAALAIAERQRASGAALLRAVTLGYDVATRLSMALHPYDFSPAGHSTNTFGGTFGAAAACATLLRLTPEQVRHVFSYAAQQAGGLSNFSRDRQHIEKSFVFGGLPARNGVTAATMVASGMTGIDDAFSGDRNFFFAYGPQADPAALVRGLGDSYEITRTTIKRWSVAAPIQAPLDSLSYLIKTNKVAAREVEKVVVRVSRQGVHSANEGAMPDVNMQQMVAVMLLDGTVTLEAAHDVARMKDPAVMALRRRVELVADDELERALPSQQGIVELTLADGRVLRHHTKDVRGTAPNPMTAEEVEEKAEGLLTPVVGKRRARAVIEAVWHIESVDDVRTLRPLLMA
jgi:2-methylcitrate dehydratase PrpD